jgi:N-acetylmuramate 1-kinase
MALFPAWFLARHLQRAISESEHTLIQSTFAALINEATSQPQVFVHRDFHSRNLMLSNASHADYRRLSIIDFQDALIGPITYDLVSLLKDCYVQWPKADRLGWLAQFHARSAAANAVSFETFTRWFDWMGVQRHLKVLGIFARLNYRDGKARYLQDLPLVLHYVLETCADYAELQGFGAWLAQITSGVDLTQARLSA